MSNRTATLSDLNRTLTLAVEALDKARESIVSKEELEPLVQDVRSAKEALRVFSYRQKPAFTAAGRVIRH